MRISKKPEERKAEILNAAEELFVTKGYAKTTIQDILNLVGIAKGTFYYYFQSKEEVMDAIIQRYIKTVIMNAEHIAANHSLNAPEKIFQILMAQQPENDRKEGMVEQLHQINNAEMHQKSLVQTVLQLTPILTSVVEQGVAEGSFKTPYPKETVEFLLVASQFLFDEGLFQWTPDEQLEKAKAFVHVMETLLGVKKGSFDYIIKILMANETME